MLTVNAAVFSGSFVDDDVLHNGMCACLRALFLEGGPDHLNWEDL